MPIGRGMPVLDGPSCRLRRPVGFVRRQTGRTSGWPGLAAAAVVAVTAIATPVFARPAPSSGAADGHETRMLRCLALIALAEAGVEGPAGMAAVMQVVQNRVRDGRFAASPCAVALEPRQFQPVGEQAWLRLALQALERERPGADPSTPVVHERAGPFGPRAVAAAYELARATLTRSGVDPTGGALFFVNPALIDAEHCRWFAGLKRTAAIGRHVFMTDRPGAAGADGPALDCGTSEPASSWSAASGVFERRPVLLVRDSPTAMADDDGEAAQAAGPARRRLIRAGPAVSGPTVLVRRSSG